MTTHRQNYTTPEKGGVYMPSQLIGSIERLKTKKNYQGVLIRMMKDALRNGDINQLPEFVTFSGGLSIPQKKPEWIDETTQTNIIREIPTEDSFIFEFLTKSGVRVSEARALRKCDIYRSLGYIAIRKTFSPSPDKEILTSIKQKRERNIPFYAALQAFWDDIPVYMNSEFVFNNSKTGKHYTKNINRDIWNPACMRALGYVFPLNNAGRHSFASQLSHKGVPIDVISELLGHSDLRVTKAHYTDPGMAAMGRIVDKIRGG